MLKKAQTEACSHLFQDDVWKEEAAATAFQGNIRRMQKLPSMVLLLQKESLEANKYTIATFFVLHVVRSNHDSRFLTSATHEMYYL